MKFTEYRETKQHGSPGFPMQYYYVNKAHPHYVMPLHWHDHLEVLRVLSGELRLFLNDVMYSAKAGDMFVINPGVLHRTEPGDCVYECVVFDLHMALGQVSTRLSDYIEPLISGKSEISQTCSSAERVIESLLHLLREMPSYYELKASSLVQELLFEFYSGGCVRAALKESRGFRHRRAQLVLMLNKIDRDYASSIGLKDLARISGMNEKYLCRFFKEFTGKTPTDYINSIRIEHACYEIVINHRTVTEAAYETGFNELGYFSRVFKKYKGVPPREYLRSAEARKNG